jgi:hypothetical protein
VQQPALQRKKGWQPNNLAQIKNNTSHAQGNAFRGSGSV